MTVQLYGLTNCSTCKKAMSWLQEHGVTYTFVDYRKQPISPQWLSQWAVQLGGWEKLVNRASMTWRNLADERKNPASDAAWLALIAEYPAVVRRPVLLATAGRVTVGFSVKKYSDLFA